MVADKLPFIGSRTAVGPLLGRASAAVYAAKTAAKRPNPAVLALAAGAAVGAAFAAQRGRKALAERLHVPQQLIGVAEDALVLGMAFAIARL